MSVRVLLMDDEPSICEITGILLKRLGYDPLITTNGQEAVDAFKKAFEEGNPVDVAILDLTVPGGMGGKDAVKELLAIDPDIKVIVTSGDANDPAIISFKNYGFSGVMMKPYNKAALDSTIKSMINTGTL